jgi:hypothetical protein
MLVCSQVGMSTVIDAISLAEVSSVQCVKGDSTFGKQASATNHKAPPTQPSSRDNDAPSLAQAGPAKPSFHRVANAGASILLARKLSSALRVAPDPGGGDMAQGAGGGAAESNGKAAAAGLDQQKPSLTLKRAGTSGADEGKRGGREGRGWGSSGLCGWSCSVG